MLSELPQSHSCSSCPPVSVLCSHHLHNHRHPEGSAEANQNIKEEDDPGEKAAPGEHQIHGLRCVPPLVSCFSILSSCCILASFKRGILPGSIQLWSTSKTSCWCIVSPTSCLPLPSAEHFYLKTILLPFHCGVSCASVLALPWQSAFFGLQNRLLSF